MNLNYKFYVVLIFFAVILSSCGGGGGSQNNLNQVVISAGSSSSLSSSSSQPAIILPVVIAPDDQIFTIEEDAVLSSDIKVNFNYVSARGDNDSSFISTLKNGVVQILPLADVNDPKIYFKYTPAEDFYGDDEAVIYLLKFNNAAEPDKQQIKIHFNVYPVVDEKLKFKVFDKKIFVAGDQIRLSLPYDPDTQNAVASNINFKLSVDDVVVNYSASADGINFVFPSKVLAGVNTVNIQFEYQGKSIKSARTIMSKIDYGDVEYWMGDKGHAGTTYVVLAENSVDRQRYLEWVNKQFTAFLSEPIIAEYSGYWNLAVIKEPSPENYAYEANPGSPIIVSDLKVSGEAYIKRFVPNYDWVILNTALSGRETGGYPMTLNFSSIRTIMHEFGHVHAKLADEYSDETYYPNPTYIEGYNPNVTNYNNYDLIPWKHWILDKTKIPGINTDGGLDGVGIFLGAYYAPAKFYRPMFTSIMRDNNASFGPVNSEAWVLATYERLGILSSVTSNKEGNVRHLTIAKTWNKNLTQVDWFINDVKQNAWVNQSSIAIDESTITANGYTVKAELTDLLGYIKNPHAYPAFKNVAYEDLISSNWQDKKNETFQKSWMFEKVATSSVKLQKQQVIVVAEAAANSDHWVSHTINIHGGIHELSTTATYRLLDTLIPVTARSELRADIIDASGKRLYSIGIDQPYFYYHAAVGLMNLKDRGAYKIKHPYINGNYQINIINLHAGQLVVSFQITQAM